MTKQEKLSNPEGNSGETPEQLEVSKQLREMAGSLGGDKSKQESEPVKSEKEILWEQKSKETDEIKDRLGEGIDGHIKEAVTAFRVYEFQTSMSCGGHAKEEGHGELYPWVMIYAQEPEGFEKSKGKNREKKEQEWRVENLQQQQKMMEKLTEFYNGRETPFDARLIFKDIGAFGGFNVQSFGGETMELLTPEQQASKLELYRKEMDEFSEFLKEKFLEQ